MRITGNEAIDRALLGRGGRRAESWPVRIFHGNGSVGVCADGTNYGMLQQVADEVYVSVPLQTATVPAPVGSATIHSIYSPYFARMMNVEDQTSVRVSTSGAGWLTQNDVNYYGGSVARSLTTGNYVEFTTPSSTRVGMVYLATSNGGMAIITIDGDATLANLLPTAQGLVTAGTLAST